MISKTEPTVPDLGGLFPAGVDKALSSDGKKTETEIERDLLSEALALLTDTQGAVEALQSVPVVRRLRLMDLIKRSLPSTSLAEMDLEAELLNQLHVVGELQREVIDNPMGTPLNQLAQISNSVTAVLMKLMDRQQDVYDSERLKRIEQALVEASRGLPTEVRAEFMKNYEKVVRSRM